MSSGGSMMFLRVGFATAVALLLARRGLKKKSLNASGAVAAFAVGFASIASGFRFGALLIGFYLSGSKLTNVKSSVKLQLDDNFKIGGQRSARQVLACSVVASIIAVYFQWRFGSSDSALIDFAVAPVESALLASYIGHYACCAADTWASELGVLSKSNPILITTLQRVPPGTNGGISLIGTIASTAGGAFIGVLYFACSMSTGTAQPHVITLGAVTGLFGSLLDSLLGATLQSTWFNKDTKKICKEGVHGPTDAHICGLDLLTNEQVNAISVLVTTLVSASIARLLFLSPK